MRIKKLPEGSLKWDSDVLNVGIQVKQTVVAKWIQTLATSKQFDLFLLKESLK